MASSWERTGGDDLVVPISSRAAPDRREMLPYATPTEAEAALGRAMTWSEAAWFRYSATTPDFCLYCHSVVFVLLVYTLAPLPLALLELRAPAELTAPYKLQPRVRLSPAAFLRCFKDTLSTVVLSTAPLPFISYPAFKVVTGLPLPSPWETAAQLLVYLLVEDYLSYWIHRLLHTEWCYDRIHRVHHEFEAPMGYAAPYAHWAEVFVLGFASFAGLAMVPCHMITFWLWFILRPMEAIDVHSGFNIPFNPTKFIPFYGGAEYHDYHHYVGKWSKSNFASIFTFCDYIYGTHKGYRYHKAAMIAKLKEMAKNNVVGKG